MVVNMTRTLNDKGKMYVLIDPSLWELLPEPKSHKSVIKMPAPSRIFFQG